MKILMLIMVLMIVGCGKQTKSITLEGRDGRDGVDGKDGSSCSVSRAYDESGFLSIGVKVSCTDGSSELVLNGTNGQNGTPGARGLQGEPGNSCSISRGHSQNFVTIQCPNNDPVVVQDGANGQDGEDGADGEDGGDSIQSDGCTLEFAPNEGNNGRKYTLTCGDLSVTFTADKD
jgi:hypothetical protein